MAAVTIIWSLAAGAALTLGAVCGLVWLAARRDRATLLLCILAVAAAASAWFELRMMLAATPAEFGQLLRWYHPVVFVALVAQILFVQLYLGTTRLWLMWSLIAVRVVVLIVNFAVEPNFNYAQIITLTHMPLFGDQIAIVGQAVTRLGWQRFALAGNFALMAYLIDASVRHWRAGGREGRRKALAVALGVTFPMFCTLFYGQLMIFGFLHVPLSNIPWFLGALLMMAVKLGRDFVVDHRALERLAELQTQLARAERVGILGHLASALAHELSQPLTANALNAEVALKCAAADPPDLAEVRAVLDDIRRDSRRGADVVDRMRDFYRLRAIEMQPLALEEVVKDALALVRADAIRKNIELSLRLPPEVPRVLGDRVHLSQVITNLLMNGIHAVESRPAGLRRVTVEARSARDAVEVAVRDSGKGIPADIAEKLFTPFFTTKPGGRGMGLPLSRAIIEAHGGNMWADHCPERGGAMFCFTLQRA
jgi:signal transduction histidine kinase